MRFSATHPKKKTLTYWLTPKHHGSFAIYLWHGMGAAAWWRLLRRNRFAMTWDCVPQILTTTVAVPFNSALRLARGLKAFFAVPRLLRLLFSRMRFKGAGPLGIVLLRSRDCPPA